MPILQPSGKVRGVEAAARDLAAALSHAAETINSPHSLEDTFSVICQTACETVPGFDAVSMTVTHSNGHLETKASTGQLVCDLDSLQHSLQEGPCYEAAHDATVVVNHARQEQRWPSYIPQAVELGLRSQLIMHLHRDAKTVSSLNLCSTSRDEVSEDAIVMAELFAKYAAIALGRSSVEHQLTEALRSRRTIGQAIGIVMMSYELTEQRAFQFLARASQHGNVKLRAVAQEIVEDAERRFSNVDR